MAEPKLRSVRPPVEGIWRVGRADHEIAWRPAPPMEAGDISTGNRFDSLSGGFPVLYCGTSREACYAETLARFRPKPELRALVQGEWGSKGWMRVGNVPRSWLDERRIVRISMPPDANFLDVEHIETRAVLEEALAAPLAYFGTEHLDVPAIRGPDRRVTRMISEWAFNYELPDGTYPFAGTRYLSKLSSELECWAIFPTQLAIRERKRIDRRDRELRKVLDTYGLNLH